MGCRVREVGEMYVSDLDRTPVLLGTLFKGISIVASLGLAMAGSLAFGSLLKPFEERFDRVGSAIEQ